MTNNEIAILIARNVRSMESLWQENEDVATEAFRAGMEPREVGKAEAASMALKQALDHYHRALFDSVKTHGDVTANFGK